MLAKSVITHGVVFYACSRNLCMSVALFSEIFMLSLRAKVQQWTTLTPKILKVR